MKVFFMRMDTMADLYFNGTIYTMTGENETQEAVLVEDNKVKRTGSYEELKEQADHFIDLQEKTMMPALTDVHQHLIMIGKKLASLALDDVTDIDLMKEKVASFDSGHQWNNILGYDENNFDNQYKIKIDELDQIGRASCRERV